MAKRRVVVQTKAGATFYGNVRTFEPSTMHHIATDLITTTSRPTSLETPNGPVFFAPNSVESVFFEIIGE